MDRFAMADSPTDPHERESIALSTAPSSQNAARYLEELGRRKRVQ